MTSSKVVLANNSWRHAKHVNRALSDSLTKSGLLACDLFAALGQTWTIMCLPTPFIALAPSGKYEAALLMA
jgi:hypothetical protein